jgi:hypothetical protein
MYSNIYVPFRKKVIRQYSIEIEKMRVSPRYFGESLSMCEEFRLLPIMELNHSYDANLIMQVYTMVHFQDGEAQTFPVVDQWCSS